MGLWRPASRGRQVAHVHLTLEKLQELPEATKQDSAIYPTRPYLPDRRQPKDPRQRRGVREGLEGHPRIGHAFIPKGAAWLNLIEGWWRICRRQAFAGECSADSYEIELATRVATRQLNRKA